MSLPTEVQIGRSLVVCITIMALAFAGDPDLWDALIGLIQRL